MITLRAGVLKRLTLTPGSYAGETWQLEGIRDLAGQRVGLDADGAALSYPVGLTAVTGTSAWYSPALQISAAGDYIASFTSSAGRSWDTPLTVEASSASSSGSTTSGGQAYATVLDLIARYTATTVCQLSDDSNTVTVEMLLAAANGDDLSAYTDDQQAAIATAMDRLNTALGDASREVDIACEGRYALPLDPVPSRVVASVCTLARFLADLNPPAHVVKRYEAEMRWLESHPNLGTDANGATAAQTKGPRASARKTSPFKCLTEDW